MCLAQIFSDGILSFDYNNESKEKKLCHELNFRSFYWGSHAHWAFQQFFTTYILEIVMHFTENTRQAIALCWRIVQSRAFNENDIFSFITSFCLRFFYTT